MGSQCCRARGQLGVRCLAQGNLSCAIEGGETAVHSLPPTIPAGPETWTRTFGLRVRPLGNHILCKPDSSPVLPYPYKNLKQIVSHLGQQYKETYTSTDTSQTGQKDEFLSLLIFKELFFLADWVLRTQTCGENSRRPCCHSDTGHLEKATHATTKALCPDRWSCHRNRQATGVQRG